jgi:hypothetical protein
MRKTQSVVQCTLGLYDPLYHYENVTKGRQEASRWQNLHDTDIVVTFVLYMQALPRLPTKIFCRSNVSVNVRGDAILTAPKTAVSLPYKLARLTKRKAERQPDITASGCVWDGDEKRGGGRLIWFLHRICTKKLTCRVTIVLSITESEMERSARRFNRHALCPVTNHCRANVSPSKLDERKKCPV